MMNWNPYASRGRKSVWVGVATALLAGCASHPKPLPLEAPGAPPPPSQQGPASPYGGPAPSGAVESQILPGSRQDFVVNVGDRIYFDYNADTISPDAARILEAQATWLKRYPQVRVRIEGNCDERGTEEYNFALGSRRASEVKQFLNQHGVDTGRITTVSYGKERPIDPGTGEEALAHNRNAHTAITEGTR